MKCVKLKCPCSIRSSRMRPPVATRLVEGTIANNNRFSIVHDFYTAYFSCMLTMKWTKNPRKNKYLLNSRWRNGGRRHKNQSQLTDAAAQSIRKHTCRLTLRVHNFVAQKTTKTHFCDIQLHGAVAYGIYMEKHVRTNRLANVRAFAGVWATISNPLALLT